MSDCAHPPRHRRKIVFAVASGAVFGVWLFSAAAQARPLTPAKCLQTNLACTDRCLKRHTDDPKQAMSCTGRTCYHQYFNCLRATPDPRSGSPHGQPRAPVVVRGETVPGTRREPRPRSEPRPRGEPRPRSEPRDHRRSPQ